MKPGLEIACFNLDSALIAAVSGADRIEFCAGYAVGGITPALSDFDLLRKRTSLPLYVMIRCRGGNFVYSYEEMEIMLESTRLYKENGADGLVFGALQANNTIDTNACRQFLEVASPLPCTFHRAFDRTLKAEESLEEIIKLGFQNLLTSGHKPNALQGAENLKLLMQQSAGTIKIIAGGGIRSTNLLQLMEQFRPDYIHSSAITDNTETADAAEVRALAEFSLSNR